MGSFSVRIVCDQDNLSISFYVDLKLFIRLHIELFQLWDEETKYRLFSKKY